MPEKETLERAQEDAREGKSPSTQAGEFVREEMHHVREGKHGAPFPPTGDRDWSFESAAIRSEIAPAPPRKSVSKDQETSQPRLSEGTEPLSSPSVQPAFARNQGRSKAGRSQRGVG
jgi:hypothetical protein